MVYRIHNALCIGLRSGYDFWCHFFLTLDWFSGGELSFFPPFFSLSHQPLFIFSYQLLFTSFHSTRPLWSFSLYFTWHCTRSKLFKGSELWKKGRFLVFIQCLVFGITINVVVFFFSFLFQVDRGWRSEGRQAWALRIGRLVLIPCASIFFFFFFASLSWDVCIRVHWFYWSQLMHFPFFLFLYLIILECLLR